MLIEREKNGRSNIFAGGLRLQRRKAYPILSIFPNMVKENRF
jgi:hypothetical protein